MAESFLDRSRVWLAEKLNPVQPSIARDEGYQSPQIITEYERAYRDVEVIRRAVDIIINACASVPIVVESGAAPKKLNKLINITPNPFEDRHRLFRRSFLDFMLDGNAFLHYDGTSLYVIPANEMAIVPDEKTFVKRYEYQLRSGGVQYGYDKPKVNNINFDPDEIIHIKSDNEESIYRGSSRLKYLKRLIELYYALTDFQRQFFKNNAIPGIVLQTDSVLSQKVKERLLEAWRNTYSNVFQGARSPAILDGGLKIESFSSVNFRELDFEASVDRLQQDMCKALGVPYVLLKSGNNANIDVNEKLLYNHTVLPILHSYCSAFQLYFAGDVKIYPDKFSISALQPDNRTQAMYYSTLVNTGIITPNEAREGLRLSRLDDPDMDNIRIPQNIVGSATNPAEGGRPSGDNVVEAPATEEQTTTEQGTVNG